MISNTLLALVTNLSILAPEAPLAQALAQVLEASGVEAVAHRAAPLPTLYTWTAYVVGKKGDTQGYLVECKASVTGMDSRAPQKEFLGCTFEPQSVIGTLPLLSLDDLFLLSQTPATIEL